MSKLESIVNELGKAISNLIIEINKVAELFNELVKNLGQPTQIQTVQLKNEYAIPSEFSSAIEDLLAILKSNVPATVIGDVLENTIAIIREKVPSHPVFEEAQKIIEKLHTYNPDEDISEEDKHAYQELVLKLKGYLY